MEYGLIGERLSHSYSKQIHEKLADYQYDLHPLSKEDFSDFMNRRPFKAINVTIPYKCDVIPYLEKMDDNAFSAGAVNTIVNNNGNLYGHNTDIDGFLYMIKKNNINIKDKKILVLGNGGASKAVIAALKKCCAREIILVNRTRREYLSVISYEDAFRFHKDADVIVNTSPVGMFPNEDEQPVDLTHFPECKAVVDIIANPLETKLTKQAKRLGMVGVTGLEMLVAQAKYAVEFFLDKKIDDAKIDVIYKEIVEEMTV